MFNSKQLVDEVLDASAFGTRGEQWFAAQLLVFALLAFPPSQVKGLVDSLGALCLVAGVAAAGASVLNLGKSLSPLPTPRKEHELVTTGLYGYARHPMYGSVLLAAFGLSAVSGDETRFVLTALLWWILDNKASLEEAALCERYPEYPAYRDKVKKFIPYVF